MEIVTNLKLLRIPSTEVKSVDEVNSTIKELEETFKNLKEQGKDGFGLAAVQIGIYKQVSIVRMKDGHELNLINPKILVKELPVVFSESCYSISGLIIKTDRYRYIQIENGLEKREIIALSDLEAIVVQHEIDHMKGRTILDAKHRRK